jgi:bacterioferritin (cytochrome b1)
MYYEYYLLRKIYKGERAARCRELLDEYFRFIGCFNIKPNFKNKNNFEIIYNEDNPKRFEPCNDYSIEEEYMKRYNNIRDKTTQRQVDKIKREVFDIIKRNSMKNIDDLNKRVLDLFKIDEDFKALILNAQPKSFDDDDFDDS